MTIKQFRTKLETATPTGTTFLFGYDFEVHQEHTSDFPVLRVYPEKWNPEPRANHFKIRQQFFVYTSNADRADAWDAANTIFNQFNASLKGTGIELVNLIDSDLFNYGTTIEEVYCVRYIYEVKIWC